MPSTLYPKLPTVRMNFVEDEGCVGSARIWRPVTGASFCCPEIILGTGGEGTISVPDTTRKETVARFETTPTGVRVSPVGNSSLIVVREGEPRSVVTQMELLQHDHLLVGSARLAVSWDWIPMEEPRSRRIRGSRPRA